MFTQLLALFAILAAANAGAILYPETKLETIPVVKTSIHGPSGDITQEEHLPVITHHEPATIVETHPIVSLHEVPLAVAPEVIQHHEVSVVHPTPLVVPHEVLPVQPIVPHEFQPIVRHDLPLVYPHGVLPIQPVVQHELPVVVPHEVPVFVKPQVPLVHPIAPYSGLVKTVPQTIPLYPGYQLYKNINGLYYH